ncbi:PKD domain-containing protein, partial [Thermodesulfovibrionales bacterium]|nr:PKD domain-containing protein [Thermodesulfovibrionales bacterium]
DWASGLQIIDVSNPRSPVIVGSVDTPGSARNVFISGNHAFVADGHSGLQIIDISAFVVEDTLPPTLAITTPAHNERLTTESVTVSGTATDAGRGDSGISRVKVNGLPAPDGTATGSGTANWHKTIFLSPGANTITVVAFDDSPRQNKATQTISVYFDPLLQISARIDNYEIHPREVTVGDSVTLDLTFTNTSDREHAFGVKAVLRSPDGTRIPLFTAATVLSLASESVSWTPTIDAPGEWSVAFSIWKESTKAERRTLLAQTGWVEIQAREKAPQIAARIDRHTVSPTEASKGDSVTIGFTFTNTGKVEHTFGARATLFRPDGTLQWFDIPVTLAPGESKTVEWPPHTVNMIGRWDVVFAVWKESIPGQLKTRLDEQEGESILVTLGADHNSPPQAGFTFATDGLRVNFTSTSTDPDNNIVSYHWQFGDGETSGERNPVHTYRGWLGIGGVYGVVHTVTDMYGRTDSVGKSVPVIARILNIFYPCSIPRGASLCIRVIVSEGGLPLTVTIGDISKTQTSRILVPHRFSFDTTELSLGEHQLTVEVEGETYASFIDILGGEHLIIGRLGGLERAAESEMREISRMAAGPLVETIFNRLADLAGDTVEKRIGTGLTKSKSKFANQMQKLLKRLDKADREVAIKELEKLGGFLAKELIAGLEEFTSGPVKRKVADGTFLSLCSDEIRAIKDETGRVESKILAQAQRLSGKDLEEISRILRAGREAIRNTDQERIYYLHIGHIPILGDITADPTLPWFDGQHQQSLDPVRRLGGAVICPIWVARMMFACGESLLTIPASLGWFTPTPPPPAALERGEIRPLAVPAAIVAAVKAYIKVARAVEKFSPWVISAGMFVSTDILADKINEKHKAAMTGINTILNQRATPASFSRPLFLEGELHVPQDDIVLTLTPTGKIVDIDFIRGGERLRVPSEYRMISLGARECFRIAAAEPPQITMQLTSCRETYELGQTARITVTMKNPTGEPLEDLLLWFFVPEEEILERATINIGAHAEVTWSHEFKVTQEMVYAPTAILSFFDTIIAEEVTSFPVGEVQQRRVFMTIDYAEFSDPGTIKMKVKVENIGNIGISPLLTFGGTFGDWTKEFPLLPPQESYLKTVSFDINEPGIYTAYFMLTEGGEILQARPVDFTVRAIDTLLASVSTDKAIYNRGDTVQVSVVIEDATFQAVEVPYALEIITPSGQVITELNFVAEEVGTYIVRATPIAEGYAVVSDETLFIVERQSDLIIEASLKEKALYVQITTEAGGPVGEVRVTANNRMSVTDKEGRAKFEYVEVTEPFLRAERVGFNPAMATVRDPDPVDPTPDPVDPTPDPVDPTPDPAPADDANGCFIATAAFGTPLAEEIDILREFRDEYLLTNELGQRFVAFYNRHSPALAEFIAEREAAKKVVRVALWPLVKIVEFIVGEEREVGALKKSSDFLGDVVTEWPGALPASAEAQMGLCQSMGRMKE